MAFCKYCGNRIEDNQVYCKNCGARIVDENPTNTIQQGDNYGGTSQVDYNMGTVKDNSINYCLGIIGALLDYAIDKDDSFSLDYHKNLVLSYVALVAGSAVFVFSKKEKKKV